MSMHRGGMVNPGSQLAGFETSCRPEMFWTEEEDTGKRRHIFMPLVLVQFYLPHFPIVCF